jgi:acyl-CoA synthetase (AMP-forming)/AMP-acid ligase II
MVPDRDLARRDGAGLITIDGRCKSVINVAGHKVFPEEVAAVLDGHPAVLRSRVTTRPHPHLGEVVHAEVQSREASLTLAPEDILAFAAGGCRITKCRPPRFENRNRPGSSGKARHG